MSTYAPAILRLATGATVAVLALTAHLWPGSVPADGEAAPRAVAARNQVDNGSKDAVRTAYLARWAPAIQTTVTSGGTASSCQAATSTSAQQRRVLDAINFARGMVGQNAVTFSTRYNAAAASAAVIMSANGQLSHTPPKSWKCWTQAGYDGAGDSNILLNSSSPSAARLVGLYLDDPGSSNTAAGHRRWLLRPRTTTMGSGNAQGAWFGNAIYVFGFAQDDSRAPAKSIYAWPSAGYFPTQLEPDGRWSLSSAGGVDFSAARVRVTGPDGKALALTQRPVVKGYADNTLVWDLAKAPAYVATDQAQVYTVTVSGLRGAKYPTYSYRVRIFDPTAR